MGCNLKGTERLVEALRVAGDSERRRLVQISTSSVYGAEACGDERTPLNPVSPYGITKLAAEQLALAYGASFGLQVVVLRYFSMYGPGQRPDMAYHIWIDALLRGEPIAILGDGEQTRGNTFIDDGVNGTLLALARGRAGQIYNIGGGVPISMNAAITLLEELTGRTAERRYRPARLGDQRNTFADVSKAHNDFGYAPRVAPIYLEVKP
jgi:nucleoside-diphosphate-sugar epimerase